MDKHPAEQLLEHFETFTDTVVDILTMGSTPLSSAMTRKLLTAHRGVKGGLADIRALSMDDADDQEAFAPTPATDFDPWAGDDVTGITGGSVSINSITSTAPAPIKRRTGAAKGAKGAKGAEVEPALIPTPVETPPPPAEEPPLASQEPPAEEPPPPADEPQSPPPPSEDQPPPPPADQA